MRLIIGGADAPPRKPDAALLKAIALAHRWFEELTLGRATSLAAIASSQGVSDRYVARLIRLAFLAPKIVEAIHRAWRTGRSKTHPACRPAAQLDDAEASGGPRIDLLLHD